MDAIIAESRRNSAQAVLPGLDKPAASRAKTQAAAAKAHAASAAATIPHLPERIAELVHVIPVRRRLADLVLTGEVVEEIKEFLDEFTQAALLRSNSLEPRHTMLLVGPPGNGKTSLAEAMAAELSLPLLSLRYDAIVDSYLGETSNRLRKLIDYASQHPCVLFFDEFDAVGKERSDAQETGEIKRVVSSLLVQMDQLPSHTLVVCATNHPELLDRAVWRRFEMVLEIDRPGREQLQTWFDRFERSLNGEPAGITADQFAEFMHGQNMSEVEAFTLDVRRKLVLSKGVLSPAGAIELVMKRGRPRLIGDLREKHSERVPNSPSQTD
ncbi:MAG: ATP-binding protein [Nevskia sp.]|nr:ATP-binding protein [Nevskia sp.]